MSLNHLVNGAITNCARVDGYLQNLDVDGTLDVAGAVVFGGVLSLPDGTALLPSLTNTGDTNTGLYFSAADEVSLTTGGSQRLAVSSVAITPTVAQLNIAGSAAAPSISFTGDPNTGLYSQAADTIGFAAAGANSASISNVAVSAALPIRAADGVVGTPAYSFTSDSDTGLYVIGANSFAACANADEVVRFSTAGVGLQAGTALAQSLNFSADVNTGLYSVGADSLGISAGGVLSETISTTAITAALPYRTQDGSAAAPSYSFVNDSDCGMYRLGANALAITVNAQGAPPVFQFLTSGVAVASPSDGYNQTWTNDNSTHVVGMYMNAASGQMAVGTSTNHDFGLLANNVTPSQLIVKTTGECQFYDGTAALPSVTFQSDADCGMYRIGANNIGLGVNGANVLNIATTGLTVTGLITNAATSGHTYSGSLSISGATPQILNNRVGSVGFTVGDIAAAATTAVVITNSLSTAATIGMFSVRTDAATAGSSLTIHDIDVTVAGTITILLSNSTGAATTGAGCVAWIDFILFN